MSKKKQQVILKILLIFILIQPLLDILSRMSILGIVPNISTYVKPLFVFGLTTYLLLKYNPKKKIWLIYVTIFSIFTIGHLYLLKMLLLDNSTIIHEFRFMLNIAYMIALFIIFNTLDYYVVEKEEMYRKIKYTLFYTFMIYFGLFLLAVATGTSGMTYEYADKFKHGYKGWYDSGQILGHAFSIMFPIILYGILKPSTNKFKRVTFMVFTLLVVSLLGTKVPYFITLSVLILYLIIILFIKFFNKEFERNIFDVIIVSISIIILLCVYKYTPVAYNTNINNINAQIELDQYDLDFVTGKRKDLNILLKKHKSENVSDLKKYYDWCDKASDYLNTLYYSKKVHPSDIRGRQFYYSYKLFSLSTIKYKLLGIGYLIQEEQSLALERDFFMAFFNFGIIGFILFLIIPIIYFIKSLYFILKNLKYNDLELDMLFMGLGVFFCISMYAGYTYIYTNFSIFLVVLITLLKLKISMMKKSIKDNRKKEKIDFLLLHLGFGGIESASINSANALCNKYEVKIVSFYHLKDNQEFKINKKVKIEYLYDGEPNKEEFKKMLKKHNLIGILKEGLKAIDILIKKKLLILKYVRKSKSDVIVSTRVEFNEILSIYGKFDILKIAQEHHYHNNNKKYINRLKHNYYNIDYLCALTSTLKKDYEKILNNNNYTQIVLLPNMIEDIPNVQSKLNSKKIITVSRLDKNKKNDEIIKAFSKIKDKNYNLIIIGDGDCYQELKNLIKEQNLEKRVVMTGYLPKSEIEKYMLNSNLYLMASLTEGLPMVLLEAMSYGVPCIAYETASGVSDIIDDGENGYIVKNRDEKIYVERINNILNNETLRKEMGKNARKKVIKFSKEEILKKWYKILK